MKRLQLVMVFLIVLAAGSHAGSMMRDDFSGGSVSAAWRIYENTIGTGWRKVVGGGGSPVALESAWTISGGVAINDSMKAATGYPYSKEAEAPLFKFLSGMASTNTRLTLRFDYAVASGDTFYVHLWGCTGTSNKDGEEISNIEASANGNVHLTGTGDTTELTTYNLKDGAASGFGGTATAISGQLTGSGTFVTNIAVADLNIPGVATAADLDYYVIQFAKNENGTAGVTSIDNLNFYTGSSVWPIVFADKESGLAPLTVAFDASESSADEGIVTYSWDFGDGNTATGMLATHTYTTAGVYSAELTITDSSNQTDTASQPITVFPEPEELGAIWFIGDSITQSNADGDSAGSPRKALYDLLAADGYTFTYTGHFTANIDGLPVTGGTASDNLYHYHSGISGSVIGDDYDGRTGMTQNLSTFWNSGRLAEVKPDIILVMLGANDVGLALDLPGAPDRLKTLIQNIYELPGAGNPTVYLAKITPNRMDDPTSSTNVDAFNAAVPGVVSELIAQGRDVRLVDHFTPVNNDYANSMRPDNLHPNATGNEIMAKQWFNAITGKFPGTPADFYSFDLFTFVTNGLNCKVAVPETVAAGKPWIWRARFWGHMPGPDIALLSNGYHVAYVDVADLFGSPTAVARYDAFYDFLTQSYGFDTKVVLEGMSRGGLIIYNWAVQNTDKVHCIYADAPVCDFKSWPGGFYDGDGNPAEWIDCTNAYGFTSEAEALAYGGNPVDNMQPLADAGIPLLHVVGDADDAVPVAENTAIVEASYIEFGGSIKVIHKPGIGHVHGLDDPTPIIDFILNNSSYAPRLSFSQMDPPVVQWQVVTGKTYTVWFKTNLTDSIWTGKGPASGSYTVPVDSATGFIRVEVEP